MDENLKEIEEVFKIFVEGTLLEHNVLKSLSVIAEDIIGIGMGNQGVVSGKMDLERILTNAKTDVKESMTEIVYEKMQIRCYDNRFGSICGVLKIKIKTDGETAVSSLGQMMGVRKEKGRWWIYAVQATPLFEKIEEMEAYPIKFAESALEKYREQEQIARDSQKGSIAIYKINFTEGVFEDSVIKNDIIICMQKGKQYESTMFQSAWKHLSEKERYRFISTFSIGNIIKLYESGQTEISMEYKMILSEEKSIWMKSVIRLYMDKVDQNLKGYLYIFDIDKEKRKEIELRTRVELDPMTELYNRKYSEIRIGEKLKNISPINQGAFFMIDLDHFKNINDTYGHQEGDHVIKEAAKCMREVIRKEDLAGRLGGDEFCIYIHGELTPDIIEEKASQLCKRIRKLVSSSGDMLETSCSIGIVFCITPDLSFDEVYQKADRALYEQKNKGRDGYTIDKESAVLNQYCYTENTEKR